MKYALLAYSTGEASEEPRPRDMHPGVAAVLERPEVGGWVRLEPDGSATTVELETSGGITPRSGRPGVTRTLLTDGPFVDSKEFLAGVILIEAEDLDGALAVAADLQQLGTTAAIEVRPVFEQVLKGA
jgi:hypothetical protein